MHTVQQSSRTRGMALCGALVMAGVQLPVTGRALEPTDPGALQIDGPRIFAPQPRVLDGGLGGDVAEGTLPTVGARWCAVSHDVPVRSAAAADAVTMARLTAAEGVMVLAAPAERGFLQVRSDSRPEVTGFVLADELSPLCFEEDLDGDGEKERAVVAYTAERWLMLLVREPLARRDPDFIQFKLLTLRPGEGAETSAVLVPRSTAGVALLRVDTRRGTQRMWQSEYFSYSVARVRPRMLGRVSTALMASYGVDSRGTGVSAEVRFQASRRGVSVSRMRCQNEACTQRGGTTEHGVFRDGRYQHQSPSGAVYLPAGR